MSEILERTWSYLTSAGSAPKWTIPSNQTTPTSHLPHGLGQFIKAVFDAPTAQHESEIVKAQLKAVHTKLQEPNLKTSTLADCIVRSMLCSLLGYSVDFVQIYALQLAQKGNITEKKIGYMGCVALLKEDSDLILLLINTIVRDLQSSNIVENNMALMTASALVPKDMAAMLVPTIIEKTAHSKDFIRKKALICLEQIAVKDPLGYSNVAIDSAIQALSDKDPGVAIVAIQVLNRLDLDYHDGMLDKIAEILTCLISIHDQILSNKLPKEFMFHGTCAPWGQMEILQLLKSFGQRMTKDENHQVILLVIRTLEQPFSDSIGPAVIYECIKTLSSILKEDYVDFQGVTEKLSKYLNILLQSKHNNEKFIGLCALEIVLENSRNFPLSETERTLVLQGLDDPDSSIQRKSFAIINAMANVNNAQDICEKIVAQQRSTATANDEVFKSMLIAKAVGVIDEHHAQLPLEWKTFILLRLLQSAKASQQKHVIMTKLQALFKKPLTNEQAGVGSKLLKVLVHPANEKGAPDTLLELYIWALAQFSSDLTTSKEDSIIRVVEKSNYKDSVSIVALQCLFNVITSRRLPLEISTTQRLTEFFSALKKKHCLSDSLQDATEEMEIILAVMTDEMVDLLGCSIGSEHDSTDYTCSYLDTVVIDAVENGSPVYQTNDDSVIFKDVQLSSPIPKGLRFTPYQIQNESELLSSVIVPLNRSKHHSRSSSSSASKLTEVWSLKGRKKEAEQGDHERVLSISSPPRSKSSNQQNFEESIIEDVNEWK